MTPDLSTGPTLAAALPSWTEVHPGDARALSEARLQLHHAAQLATAFGISYVPARADDSHTNLEWLPESGALASNARDGVRIAVRVRDLAVLVQGETLSLQGQTMEGAAAWIRERLSAAGIDGTRYTLERHYEIPAHPVAQGSPFNADAAHLTELAHWFGNAAALFEALRRSDPAVSEVRCWPHHFDIATLITVAPGKTVGVGLEPGDVYYDEPYFYVNLHPSPSANALPASLRGGGQWHTREWIGVVLPASRLSADPAAQSRQAGEFLESAVRTCKGLVRR